MNKTEQDRRSARVKGYWQKVMRSLSAVPARSAQSLERASKPHRTAHTLHHCLKSLSGGLNDVFKLRSRGVKGLRSLSPGSERTSRFCSLTDIIVNGGMDLVNWKFDSPASDGGQPVQPQDRIIDPRFHWEPARQSCRMNSGVTR